MLKKYNFSEKNISDAGNNIIRVWVQEDLIEKAIPPGSIRTYYMSDPNRIGDHLRLTDEVINEAVDYFKRGIKFRVHVLSPEYRDGEPYWYEASSSDWHGHWITDRELVKEGMVYIERIDGIDRGDGSQTSSPVSMNDLLNVPTGLIGALQENGQILSVKAGEVFDISAIDPNVTQASMGWTDIAIYTGVGLWLTGRLAIWLFPPIVNIASAGDLEKFTFLLQGGANVNARSIMGWTPLTVASQNGHIKIVKILLTNGAEINTQDKRGYSALMNASHNGHEAIVDLLLEPEWGVDVDLRNTKNGATALYFAAQKGYRGIVESLLDRGANINLQTYDRGSALGVVAQQGRKNVVELLLARGANINMRNNEGMTALMLAVYHNRKDVAQLLLSKGADVNIRDDSGRTAFDDAQKQGNQDIINLLNSFKAKGGGQSSSPVTEQGTGGRVQGTELRANDERRNTSDEVGGIDMNTIDLERQGAGVDIQFDPAQLQEIIDLGIDGFAPVIINIAPLPSVLPLLGLEPQKKEDELEVSRLN